MKKNELKKNNNNNNNNFKMFKIMTFMYKTRSKHVLLSIAFND